MINIEKIPPLSGVALKVMEMDPDSPQADVATMESIISPDKGISGELLRVANSALYGRSGRIKTLRDAVALLGLKTVKNLVIMLSVSEMNRALKAPVYQRYLQEFPVVSALLTLDLGRVFGIKSPLEEAFLGALLHRIGMTILAINRPDHYQVLLDFASKGKESLVQLEEKSYQINQNQVTQMVCDAWKLPPDLAEPLMNADCSPEDIGAFSDVTRLTIAAAVLAERMLDIRLMRNPDSLLLAVLQHYAVKEQALERFKNGYIKQIQDHPFYQQALSG